MKLIRRSFIFRGMVLKREKSFWMTVAVTAVTIFLLSSQDGMTSGKISGGIAEKVVACFSQKEAQTVVDKVEAAIGMNTEIGDEAAIVFAAQFYSSIGFGKNLQQAFDQAKAALLLKGIAEEHTPVLYVRKGLLAQDIVMVESEALKKSDNVTIMQKIKNIFS